MKKVNTSFNGKSILLTIISFIFIFFLIFISIQPAFGKIQRTDQTISLNGAKSRIDFSSFLGGSDGDYASGIALTNDSCYVAGYTSSTNFPTLEGYNDALTGGTDCFITKISNEGSIQWSTYFGGGSGERCNSVANSSDGSCYITGDTSSDDFPVLNAYNDTFSGGAYDVFVTKFASNGTLLWSTYFGGNESDFGYSIAVASDGSCFVAGATKSPDFPTLNAFNDTLGYWDAFLAKFSSEGVLLWSTYLGGSDVDGLSSCDLEIANDDSCYIVSSTHSDDFPVLNAYDSSHNGNRDIFIAKFSTNGSLQMSTYFGGKNVDFGTGIAIDNMGDYYVTGGTWSEDFPTMNGYEIELSGIEDITVTKFSLNHILLWSTYLGGSREDACNGIAIGSDDNCYIAGLSNSNDFPLITTFIKKIGTGDILYYGLISIFSSQGSLLGSAHLGGDAGNDVCFGITLGVNDAIYITGVTSSANFPIQNAFSSTFNGGTFDAFVTRLTVEITDNRALVIGLSIGIPIIVIGGSVTTYLLIRKKRKENQEENISKGG